jgi:spermidine synthase
MDLLKLMQHGRAYRLRAPEGTYSFYHPERLFTGLGWDAQTASLLLATQPVQSILILGLGGGTVARQCRALMPDLAYRNFAIGSLSIEAISNSGQSYLRSTNQIFDAIIDDMWLPSASELKPILIENDWAHLIKSRLSQTGLYAVNLYSRRESSSEARIAVNRLRKEFRLLREVQPGPGQTTVIVAGQDLLSPKAARTKLRSLRATFANDLSHVRFRSL